MRGKKLLTYIVILVTSRNGDRKIMPSVRITRKPPLRIRKCNHLSQIRGISTTVIPVNLSWPYLDDEPRAQEKQQAKDQ